MTYVSPKAGVTGRCSVAMWMAGSPAGTCDAPAYGEQYKDPFLPPQWAYNKNNRPPLAMGYCCERHGGPSETGTRFMRDGNAWMAFRPGFENLQESIAGFGPTQAAAYDDMARNIAADIRSRRTPAPKADAK
jgi:hypothetical protein